MTRYQHQVRHPTQYPVSWNGTGLLVLLVATRMRTEWDTDCASAYLEEERGEEREAK
jgi:hypothetical protein